MKGECVIGEPNYVLYANDAEWVPKENQKALSIVKKIIWGYIGVIVAFFLVVGENMFHLKYNSLMTILYIFASKNIIARKKTEWNITNFIIKI